MKLTREQNYIHKIYLDAKTYSFNDDALICASYTYA